MQTKNKNNVHSFITELLNEFEPSAAINLKRKWLKKYEKQLSFSS